MNNEKRTQSQTSHTNILTSVLMYLHYLLRDEHKTAVTTFLLYLSISLSNSEHSIFITDLFQFKITTYHLQVTTRTQYPRIFYPLLSFLGTE